MSISYWKILIITNINNEGHTYFGFNPSKKWRPYYTRQQWIWWRENRRGEESDTSSDSTVSLLTETDESDIDSDLDSNDDFEVPRDLQHERRMAALRKENARLEQICREQNYELYAMQIGIEELRRATAEMYAKRDALRAQKQRDLQ